jgi:hypothetical protein
MNPRPLLQDRGGHCFRISAPGIQGHCFRIAAAIASGSRRSCFSVTRCFNLSPRPAACGLRPAACGLALALASSRQASFRKLKLGAAAESSGFRSCLRRSRCGLFCTAFPPSPAPAIAFAGWSLMGGGGFSWAAVGGVSHRPIAGYSFLVAGVSHGRGVSWARLLGLQVSHGRLLGLQLPFC